MYGDQPLCRREVEVIQGRITGVELALAMKARGGTQRGWDKWAEAVLYQHICGTTENRSQTLPPCTVLICTRDRPADLNRCLRAVAPSIDNDVEVIVVDNDPSDDQTKLIASQYPVRYYRQARRGVNWARARGARLAKHELLLYVDDDVVVSSNWIDEMRRPFLNDNVGAVTGAVEPLELETSGQYDHEQFSSFYRGFDSKTYNLVTSIAAAAGQTGAGASMAVRKSVAVNWRAFDAELDGGTAAKSGGDVYALYRILRAGYSVIYAPSALAWHRHRKTHADLERMLYGYSVGGYCVLLSALCRERDPDALLVSLSWFRHYHLRELWRSLRRRPGHRPLSLIVREIRGVLDAPLAYWKCRRKEQRLGPLPDESAEVA
jgi:glycosyltransferase involved in cell wall biosynthesis